MHQILKLPREVWTLTFSRLIMAFGFAVSFPYISIYLYQVRELPMSLIGSMLTTAYVSGVVGRIVGGILISRIGRKKVLVGTFYIRSLLFLFISLVVWKNLHPFLFVPALMLNSFFFNIFMTTVDTIIADVTDPSNRNLAYSTNRVGINLGWAAGPAIGGFLAEISYAILFLITALTTLTAGIINHLFIRETGRKESMRQERKSLNLIQVLKDRRFMIFVAMTLTLYVSMSQIISTLSVYATSYVGISKSQLGIAYTINGLLVVFFQIPVSLLVIRMNELKALISGLLLYSIAYFSIGFATNLFYIIGAIIVITFSEMLSVPTTQSLVSKMSPKDRIPSYMGVFGLFQGLGWAIGPMVGGIIMDALAPNGRAIWTAISFIPLMGAIGFFLYSRFTKL